jgi:RecA-family ATPase
MLIHTEASIVNKKRYKIDENSIYLLCDEKTYYIYKNNDIIIQ